MTLIDQPCSLLQPLDVPVKNNTKLKNGNTDKLTSSFRLSPHRQIIIAHIFDIGIFLFLFNTRSSGQIGCFGSRASMRVGTISMGMSMSVVRSFVV
jgi:hypothetical protein